MHPIYRMHLNKKVSVKPSSDVYFVQMHPFKRAN
jgi:hypothetical protein